MTSRAVTKVAITGANGYLGSWTMHLLEQPAYRVVGYDLDAAARAPVERWVIGDVLDLETLAEALQGCDALIHLAVLPQYRSHVDPVADLQINALGTLQALRAAETAGVKRFIYTSSSAVYGAQQGCLRETSSLQPLTHYAVSKSTGEAYCGLFARTGRMHTTIVRLFNIFGTDIDGSLRITVEGQFIRSVLQAKRPVIEGDPGRAFDFVHVEDVMRVIGAILAADLPNGLTLNVGSGNATSLAQLAEWCLDAAGMDIKPDVKTGDSRGFGQWADLSQIRKYLHYEPAHDLRSWVYETVRLGMQSR